MSKSLTAQDIAKLPYRRNVGIMMVNGDNRVFVAQRIDNPGPALQMPQGGIDKGEDPREAALRELEEETGVRADLVTVEAETDGWISYDLPPDLLHKLWGGKYRGQEQKWYLLRFHGTDGDINIATEHPEFSEWHWVALDDVVERIVPFKRAVYEQVVAAFRSYLT